MPEPWRPNLKDVSAYSYITFLNAASAWYVLCTIVILITAFRGNNIVLCQQKPCSRCAVLVRLKDMDHQRFTIIELCRMYSCIL